MKDSRYEEALERAKELHEAGNALTKSQMEIVFPELKESEDERIRKEIIDWMKGGTTYDWRENKEKWLAYLERQKEQQPAEWSEEDERKIVELKTFIAQCNGFNKENRKKAFDMIDAIRHQHLWKPSEGQMKWLKDVIETVPMTCRQQVPLESLYADLQKLL